jgi:hypothetical protein
MNRTAILLSLLSKYADLFKDTKSGITQMHTRLSY